MRALALMIALSGVALAEPCLLSSSSWTADVKLRATTDGAPWARLGARAQRDGRARRGGGRFAERRR